MDGSSYSSCDGDKRVDYPTFVPNCLDKRVIFVRIFVDIGGLEYGMAIGECLEENNVWGCWGYGWDGFYWGHKMLSLVGAIHVHAVVSRTLMSHQ